MRRGRNLLVTILLLAASYACGAQQPETYRGFDRNVYPGDALLPTLRKNFQFTGYWLNNPPGESSNSWVGKRALLKKDGFGFLVLFNGRTDAELRGQNAAALGGEDGKTAVAAAAREGFPTNVIIFLDQEEGGRLLPEQAAYLFAWVDAVRAAGARAGVYCSAIPVPDGPGQTISTAQDIVERESARAATTGGGNAKRLAIWAANDACPPSPGCALDDRPMWADYSPSSGDYAAVWQYALSPRRAQFSAGCPQNQAPDGMCYAPGVPQSNHAFVDLDVARSPDPSEQP